MWLRIHGSERIYNVVEKSFEHQFVYVAPAPIFSGFEGLNDGVLAVMKMLGGVLVGRAVATTDVSADEA